MDEDWASARGVQFGIFDHVDASGLPLAEHLENRLRLTEAYDRLGFRGYHVAEHHGTPLGLAPSPSVLLAAVAQRTSRLRIGPLVYLLPLHPPLRLIEEVCMLDQMSRGRLMLGVGRGVSPIELGFHGIDAAEAPDRFREALAVLLRGLVEPRLDFAGRFYRFDDVPMTLRPWQRPYPELWYGAGSRQSAAWAAELGVNIVLLAPAAAARAVTDHFRAEWARLGKPAADRPFAGVSRHIVVAADAAEAKAIAARAYACWQTSFYQLWDARGIAIPRVFPQGWDAAEAQGLACAGTPDQVRRYVAGEVGTAGIDYLAADFAFGDMTFGEAARSAELFAAHVMPAFAPRPAR